MALEDDVKEPSEADLIDRMWSNLFANSSIKDEE